MVVYPSCETIMKLSIPHKITTSDPTLEVEHCPGTEDKQERNSLRTKKLRTSQNEWSGPSFNLYMSRVHSQKANRSETRKIRSLPPINTLSINNLEDHNEIFQTKHCSKWILYPKHSNYSEHPQTWRHAKNWCSTTNVATKPELASKVGIIFEKDFRKLGWKRDNTMHNWHSKTHRPKPMN